MCIEVKTMNTSPARSELLNKVRQLTDKQVAALLEFIEFDAN